MRHDRLNMTTTELQLEGLPGPTHNYAGLSFGNVASSTHGGSISNPRAAALQALGKMNFLYEMGIEVAVMPPHPRPMIDVLHRLGYQGFVHETLILAQSESPELLNAIWSASPMWAANAATVTPSTDSSDRRVHFTPANLFSTLHRSFEPRVTTGYLRQIFSDNQYFTVHDPLPVTTRLADEGAANHMRFADSTGANAHHVFVYGASPESALHPMRFPARQQLAASQSVARLHGLGDSQVTFVQQNPDAIDAGVFHHDVIGMSHANLMIIHQQACINQVAFVQQMQDRGITVRVISTDELSIEQAVKSYFFNAQLVSVPTGGIAILFPQECAEDRSVNALCERLKNELGIISQIHFLDLRESMKNGGGPACLRLRVPLNAAELAAMHQGVRFDLKLYQQLKRLVESSYRESISPADLRDAAFADEALATHTKILDVLSLS